MEENHGNGPGTSWAVSEVPVAPTIESDEWDDRDPLTGSAWQTRAFSFAHLLVESGVLTEEQVKQAVKTCVYRCAFSDEAVQSTLDYKPAVRIGDMDLSYRPDLAAVSNPVRPVSTYEALCAVAVTP